MPITTMATRTDSLWLLRLMQLTSPALPVGGFTYSQGLEWAVEARSVRDPASLEDWLLGQVHDGLAGLDLPILVRMLDACRQGDQAALLHWSVILVASRETAELRAEEGNRGRALTSLLAGLDVERAVTWRDVLVKTQAAPYALAATAWGIDQESALAGYAWGWLECQVAAAVKLVPLGQTDGQRVQMKLAGAIPGVVERALACVDGDIGASAPMLAVASSRHETQYTRLFRS